MLSSASFCLRHFKCGGNDGWESRGLSVLSADVSVCSVPRHVSYICDNPIKKKKQNFIPLSRS